MDQDLHRRFRVKRVLGKSQASMLIAANILVSIVTASATAFMVSSLVARRSAEQMHLPQALRDEDEDQLPFFAEQISGGSGATVRKGSTAAGSGGSSAAGRDGHTGKQAASAATPARQVPAMIEERGQQEPEAESQAAEGGSATGSDSGQPGKELGQLESSLAAGREGAAAAAAAAAGGGEGGRQEEGSGLAAGGNVDGAAGSGSSQGSEADEEESAEPEADVGEPTLSGEEWAGWDESAAEPQVLIGFKGHRPNFSPAPELDTSLAVDEVNVLVATGHFFGEDAYNRIEPCEHRRRQITCRYAEADALSAEDADALWFHAPSIASDYAFPERAFPEQAFILMSLEGSPYYPHLDDPTFLMNFDLTTTYRLDDDMPYLYLPLDIRESDESSLPGFEEREAKVAYINSNCSPLNDRNALMERLWQEQGVPVASMGQCMHNAEEQPGGKVENMKRYRVCVGIENSNSQDYVSEKLWNVFEAGCVPIYQGAPNIKADFLPADDSAILVDDYPKIEDLAAEINRVLNDKEAWEQYTAWRRKPFEELNEGYRTRLRIYQLPHPRCQICQILADRKILRLSRAAGGQLEQG